MRKSEEARLLIVKDRENGLSYSEIALRHQISKQGAKKIVDKYQQVGNVKTQHGGGRKRKTTGQDDRRIYIEARKNPSKSARMLKEDTDLDVSVWTVRRRLKEAGLNSYIAKKRPLISAINKKKRLDFAKTYENMPAEFWNSVIWSDESKFELKNPKKRMRVWCTQKDRFKDGFIQKTVKHGGGSIMLWGCFSKSGVGKLVKIEGRMTGNSYVSLLEENLTESANMMSLGQFVFQQDNDPKHTSRVAKLYFQENNIEMLKWPPQSPDLNPIEHLWAILDQKIPISARNNINTFWDALQRQWELLPNEIISNLVASMPNRIKAVKESKGGATKY